METNSVSPAKANTKLTSLERKWVMYDVGNSAWVLFAATITPIYFNSLAGSGNGIATIIWGIMSSIVALIALFVCPIFGTMADFSGKRKFFLLFALVGIISCAFLAIPALPALLFASVHILTDASLSASNVFYDSMLSDVTDEERLHKVSTNGFAWGYIGSCIPFAVCLVLVLAVPNSVMSMQWRMSLSFLLTATWWLCFTLPIFKSYRQKNFLPKPPHPIRSTFKRIGEIYKEVRKNKKAFLFLVAFFLYINGTSTIIKMATVYGSDMLGFGTTMLLIALLVTQIVAFPSAIALGALSKKFKAKHLIITCICGYVAVGLFALFLKAEWQFWVLAVCVGLFQGGIQAMSRSYFTSIIPANKSGEYFGIYDIFSKGAACLGPVLISGTTFLVGKLSGAFDWFANVTTVMNLDLLPIPTLTIAGLIVFLLAAKLPIAKEARRNQPTDSEETDSEEISETPTEEEMDE